MSALDRVSTHGFAIVRASGLVDAAAREPWTVARALLGEEPRLIERQPIRPTAGGRSFASRTGPAALHTDSQLFLGRPADLQVLFCVRPASRGGETVLCDGRAIAERVAREDPALFDASLSVERTFPFVFGDVTATTLSADEDLIVTHPPVARDPIGMRLAPIVEAVPKTTFPLGAGDVLLVDNHRMLHGRTAFDDPRRALERVLVWRRSRRRADDPLVERARREGRKPTRLADREVPPPRDAAETARRAEIVDQMRNGVPPGVLAARHAVPESWLYVLRDAASARACGT